MGWSRVARTLIVLVVVVACADDGGGTAATTAAAPVTVTDPIDLSAEGQQSASGRVTIPGFDEVQVSVTWSSPACCWPPPPSSTRRA